MLRVNVPAYKYMWRGLDLNNYCYLNNTASFTLTVGMKGVVVGGAVSFGPICV